MNKIRNQLLCLALNIYRISVIFGQGWVNLIRMFVTNPPH